MLLPVQHGNSIVSNENSAFSWWQINKIEKIRIYTEIAMKINKQTTFSFCCYYYLLHLFSKGRVRIVIYHFITGKSDVWNRDTTLDISKPWISRSLLKVPQSSRYWYFTVFTTPIWFILKVIVFLCHIICICNCHLFKIFSMYDLIRCSEEDFFVSVYIKVW